MLTTNADESDELLGGSGAARTPPASADPVATSVLVKGEAVASAAGRADDYSWPPRMPNLKFTEPLPPSGSPVFMARPAQPRPAGQTAQAGSRAARASPASRCCRARSRRSRAVRAARANGARRRRPITARRAASSDCSGNVSQHAVQRGSVVDPIRNLSIAFAHWRPSRIAHTTSDCPRRMSPAANTFGTEVL